MITFKMRDRWAIAKGNRLVVDDLEETGPWIYGSKRRADLDCRNARERAVLVSVTITEIKPKTKRKGKA